MFKFGASQFIILLLDIFMMAFDLIAKQLSCVSKTGNSLG